MDLSPSVAVVIPTTGRASVFPAVRSVLGQSYQPEEVIVVIDSDPAQVPAGPLSAMSSLVRVIYSGGIGANGARMHAASEAKTDLIAFLDDDDVWLPAKLERQVELWRNGVRANSHWLASCRVAIVSDNGETQQTLPFRLLGPRERVATYLFRRTSIMYGEGLLHTSTLICDRALLEAEPLDIRLTRHQDWDWVLRVGDRGDVVLDMCPDVLVGVATPDRRSVSRSPDWRTSIKWVEDRRDRLTAREVGDFLLCHTTPIAVRAGHRRGALVAAARAVRSGRPGFKAWIVWATHMLSPRLVETLSAFYLRAWRHGRAGAANL